MTAIWIIIAVVYIAGLLVSYFTYFAKLKDNTEFEKVYFAVIWPLLLPLYAIHYLHNKS